MRAGGTSLVLFVFPCCLQEELQVLNLACSLLMEEEVDRKERQLHSLLEEKKTAKVREGGREGGWIRWKNGWMEGKMGEREGEGEGVAISTSPCV